jgi:hypothetical protein
MQMENTREKMKIHFVRSVSQKKAVVEQTVAEFVISPRLFRAKRSISCAPCDDLRIIILFSFRA